MSRFLHPIEGGRSALPAPSPNLERLWADYCRARAAAEASHDIRVGIEAGKKWKAWLAAFTREPCARECRNG